MGTYRKIQTTKPQQNWMVIPDNDLSDIFIGGYADNRFGSHPQSAMSRIRPRSQNAGTFSKRVYIEGPSKFPPEDRSVLEARGAVAFYDQSNDQPHNRPQSLTSQIMSELHRRAEPPKNRPVISSLERPALNFQLKHGDVENRSSLSTSRYRGKYHSNIRDGKGSINFSERSLALSIVRSRSALSNRSHEQYDSPRVETSSANQSPRSSNSLSPRDAERPVTSRSRVQTSLVYKRQRQPKHQGNDATTFGEVTRTSKRKDTSPSSPSPSATAQDRFGSHDSGISNPDLYSPEQSPAYNQTASVRKQPTIQVLPSDEAWVFPSDNITHDEATEQVDSSDFKYRTVGHIDKVNTDNDTDFPDPQHPSPNVPTLEAEFVSPKPKPRERDLRADDNHAKRDHEDDEEDEDELPEYLDSFQTASALTFRRPSLWNRVRDIGTTSLINDFGSIRASSSLNNSVTSGVGGSSTLSNDAFDGDGRHGNRKKRCPNCGEELQRAPTRFVAVRGNERNFLSWLLGNWGKPGRLQDISTIGLHVLASDDLRELISDYFCDTERPEEDEDATTVGKPLCITNLCRVKSAI
ncbi:hypothetical protein PoB_005924200 [Plakobranchus ocellatus]|uniref:Uncharacterized protein n=1 Tax=Plakobranchus ocellatus TaxID=259542 RepID=A0AAV4CM07_9GAST|nr:hypothetical protein PoB_005924200 [Plakobranchus ocellatus]